MTSSAIISLWDSPSKHHTITFITNNSDKLPSLNIHIHKQMAMQSLVVTQSLHTKIAQILWQTSRPRLLIRKHPPSRTAPKYSTLNKMNPFQSNIEEYLVNPIWVENSKTSKLPPCTLLSHRPQITLELQLGNTLIFGFPIHNTLAHRPLPAPSAHSNAVDYVALHRVNDSFFLKLETRDRHWLSQSPILQHIPGLTRDRRGGRAGEKKKPA